MTTPYINESRLPFPFCPGCTHGVLLSALERALQKTNADPKTTILVSDIGCVGMADPYFNLHTFHGLHGRSFTYACGIKMARPDLDIVVIVGDGGCSIGGNHLINAARRNIGLTVLCFNNLNYGMTGGEQSVTTPLGGITNSSLNGSLEPPMDLCALVEAAGAGFVARKTAYDEDLDATIAAAMQHPGFAFIDVWEVCTAYYSPMNHLEKENLQQVMRDLHLKTGVLVQKEGEEFSKKLRIQKSVHAPAEKDRGISAKYHAGIPGGRYDLLIAGSAGMKVISAAGLLCQAGILSDLWVTQKDDYPVTVKTGHSLSTVSLSNTPIDDLCGAMPQAVIVLSKDGLQRIQKVLQVLGKDAVVLADETLLPLHTQARVLALDMGKKATRLEKTQRAMAAIAVILRERHILPVEAIGEAIAMMTNERVRDENRTALEIGAKLTIKK